MKSTSLYIVLTTLVFILTSIPAKSTEEVSILWDGSHGSRFITEDYSLAGHYAKLVTFLKDNGFSLGNTQFSKDNLGKARVLVLTVNTENPYIENELQSIQDFVKNGGGLLALCDAKDFDHSQINNVLKSFGITCGEGDEIPQIDVKATLSTEDSVFKGISEVSFKLPGTVMVNKPARIIASSTDGKALDIISVAEVGKGRVVAIGDMDVFADSLFEKNEDFALAVFKWLSTNNDPSEKPRNNEPSGPRQKPNGNSDKREEVEKKIIAEGDYCKKEEIDNALEQAKDLVNEAKTVLSQPDVSGGLCEQQFMAKYRELHSGLEGTKERLEKFQQACILAKASLEEKLKPLTEKQTSLAQCVNKEHSPSSTKFKGETSSSVATSALDTLRFLKQKTPAEDPQQHENDSSNVVGCEYNLDISMVYADLKVKYRWINALVGKFKTGISFYDPEYEKDGLNLEQSKYSSLNEVEIQLKEISERVKLCEQS